MVNFNLDTDIPSLAGKIILVTGGTDGLGKESVHQLAKHSPGHIYVTARSNSKADAMLKELDERNADHAPITFIDMDLNSFDSIKAAALKFKSMESRLDILICNAAVASLTGQTKEGYEIDFGVNHMGHALLIQLLLPTLLSTANGPKGDVRVVIVASEGEFLFRSDKYTFDDMKTDLSAWGNMSRYGQSKLANIHYATLLAKKYPEAETGVKFVSIHPGAVYTNLGNEAFARFPWMASMLKRFIGFFIKMVDVQDGARNQLWAATAPREEVQNGEYFVPIGITGKGTAKVRNMEMAQSLWDYTEKELQGHV